VHAYREAIAALATMQKETTTDTGWLFAMGAEDWSCARMAQLCESFFAEADIAMRAQVSTKVQPLTHFELYRLQRDLEEALEERGETDIPDSLLHGDIGRGNLILSPHGPVFLDWAQAHVGDPFISAEHLIAGAARSAPLSTDDSSVLRHFYASQWRGYGVTEVSKAMLLAPAIAAFAYALFVWQGQRQQDSTRIWPLLRSLLRRSRDELQLAYQEHP
jgi:thiamine kinase-like enzyme